LHWLAGREQEAAKFLGKWPESKAVQRDAQEWAALRAIADAGVQPAPIRIRLVFQRTKCLDYSRMP
jgi:hypothetical protein